MINLYEPKSRKRHWNKIGSRNVFLSNIRASETTLDLGALLKTSLHTSSYIEPYVFKSFATGQFASVIKRHSSAPKIGRVQILSVRTVALHFVPSRFATVAIVIHSISGTPAACLCLQNAVIDVKLSYFANTVSYLLISSSPVGSTEIYKIPDAARNRCPVFQLLWERNLFFCQMQKPPCRCVCQFTRTSSFLWGMVPWNLKAGDPPSFDCLGPVLHYYIQTVRSPPLFISYSTAVR